MNKSINHLMFLLHKASKFIENLNKYFKIKITLILMF